MQEPNKPPALDGDDGELSKLPALDGNFEEEQNYDEDTYVYCDFSMLPPPQHMVGSNGVIHPQSLQAQKLPAKLASMLSDHGK